jgi:hypothetical protein
MAHKLHNAYSNSKKNTRALIEWRRENILFRYWWSGSALLARPKNSPLIPGLNLDGRPAILTEVD